MSCKAQGFISAVLICSHGPNDYFYETVNGKRRRVPAFEADSTGLITKIHRRVTFKRYVNKGFALAQ